MIPGIHGRPTQRVSLAPRIIVGLAILLGALMGMMLSGFGPMAARLSVGSIGGALVAAVVVSWLGAVFLQTRWLAALLFCSPLLLGLLFAVLTQQWGRCMALATCMVIPLAGVGLFGFSRKQSGDRGA